VQTPNQDPGLLPTPDYGSLGPNPEAQRAKVATRGAQKLLPLVAMMVGVFCALVVVSGGTAQAAWNELSELLSLTGKPKPASPAILSEHEIEGLDRTTPQVQAQLLLERAINHYDGATSQIAARVDRWRGKIKLDSSLNNLFMTALNSNDLRVRAAAIEVDLAALGIEKSSARVDQLAAQAESDDQKTKVWALWTLGLLGNRGVEPGRVAEILRSRIHDSNEDVRYWAVEGLAYLGTDEVIEPLLQIFHDDPSPTVRERAACGLAQSGMLNEQQRRSAIPRLLEFAEDSSLDTQTHRWVYQALRDITGQSLPSDPSAWRNWYSNNAS